MSCLNVFNNRTHLITNVFFPSYMHISKQTKKWYVFIANKEALQNKPHITNERTSRCFVSSAVSSATCKPSSIFDIQANKNKGYTTKHEHMQNIHVRVDTPSHDTYIYTRTHAQTHIHIHTHIHPSPHPHPHPVLHIHACPSLYTFPSSTCWHLTSYIHIHIRVSMSIKHINHQLTFSCRVRFRYTISTRGSLFGAFGFSKKLFPAWSSMMNVNVCVPDDMARNVVMIVERRAATSGSESWKQEKWRESSVMMIDTRNHVYNTTHVTATHKYKKAPYEQAWYAHHILHTTRFGCCASNESAIFVNTPSTVFTSPRFADGISNSSSYTQLYMCYDHVCMYVLCYVYAMITCVYAFTWCACMYIWNCFFGMCACMCCVMRWSRVYICVVLCICDDHVCMCFLLGAHICTCLNWFFCTCACMSMWCFMYLCVYRNPNTTWFWTNHLSIEILM